MLLCRASERRTSASFGDVVWYFWQKGSKRILSRRRRYASPPSQSPPPTRRAPAARSRVPPRPDPRPSTRPATKPRGEVGRSWRARRSPSRRATRASRRHPSRRPSSPPSSTPSRHPLRHPLGTPLGTPFPPPPTKPPLPLTSSHPLVPKRAGDANQRLGAAVRRHGVGDESASAGGREHRAKPRHARALEEDVLGPQHLRRAGCGAAAWKMKGGSFNPEVTYHRSGVREWMERRSSDGSI